MGARDRRPALGRWRGFLGTALLDLAAPALALGYAVGRIGCQLSGDGDYGKPWDGPWAMSYPDGTVPTDEQVPRPRSTRPSRWAWWPWSSGACATGSPAAVSSPSILCAGLERMLVEFVRRNDDVALGLTQPQLISIAMVVAGAVWLAALRGRRAPPGDRLRSPAPLAGSRYWTERSMPPSSGITAPVR